MFATQKRFEESVTIINESDPAYGSGGIAIITDTSSKSIKAVVMPDYAIHRETNREGQSTYERAYMQVRKTEMDKIDMIPGRTRVTWNGYSYRVVNIIDVRNNKFFRNAEVEMRRRLDIN